MNQKKSHRSVFSQTLAMTVAASMVLTTPGVTAWADTTTSAKKTSTAAVLQSIQSGASGLQSLYATLQSGSNNPIAYSPVLKTLTNPNSATEAQTIASEADYMADRLPGNAVALESSQNLNFPLWTAMSGESHANVNFLTGLSDGNAPISVGLTQSQYSSLQSNDTMRQQVQAVVSQMDDAQKADLTQAMQLSMTADNAQLTANGLLLSKQNLPNLDTELKQANSSVDMAKSAADQAAQQIVDGNDASAALANMESQVKLANEGITYAQQAYRSAYNLWQKNQQIEQLAEQNFQTKYQLALSIDPAYAAKLKQAFDQATADRKKALYKESSELTIESTSITNAVKSLAVVTSGQYLEDAKQKIAQNSSLLTKISFEVSNAQSWLKSHETSIIKTAAGAVVVMVGGALMTIPIPVVGVAAGLVVAGVGASLLSDGVHGLLSATDPATLKSNLNAAQGKLEADQNTQNDLVLTATQKLWASGDDLDKVEKTAAYVNRMVAEEQSQLMAEAGDGGVLDQNAKQLRSTSDAIVSKLTGMQPDIQQLRTAAAGGSLNGIPSLVHQVSADFGNINSSLKSAFGNGIIAQNNEYSQQRQQVIANALGISTTGMDTNSKYLAYNQYLSTMGEISDGMADQFKTDKDNIVSAATALKAYNDANSGSLVSKAFGLIVSPADGIYDSVVAAAGGIWNGIGHFVSSANYAAGLSMQSDGAALWLAHVNALDQNPLVSLMEASPVKYLIPGFNGSLAQTGLASFGIDSQTKWSDSTTSEFKTQGVWVNSSGAVINPALQGLLGEAYRNNQNSLTPDNQFNIQTAASQVTTSGLAEGWLNTAGKTFSTDGSLASGAELGAKTLLVLGDKALKVGTEMAFFGELAAPAKAVMGAMDAAGGGWSMASTGIDLLHSTANQIMQLEFTNGIIDAGKKFLDDPTWGNAAYTLADFGGTVLGMGSAGCYAQRSAMVDQPDDVMSDIPRIRTGLAGTMLDLAASSARAGTSMVLQVAGGLAGGTIGTLGEVAGVMAGGRVAEGLTAYAQGTAQSSNLAQQALDQTSPVEPGSAADSTARLGSGVVQGLMGSSSLDFTQLKEIADGNATEPVDLKPSGAAGALYSLGRWMSGTSEGKTAFEFDPQNKYVQDAARNLLEEKAKDDFGDKVQSVLSKAIDALSPLPQVQFAGDAGLLGLSRVALSAASGSVEAGESPSTESVTSPSKSSLYENPQKAVEDLTTQTNAARAAYEAKPEDSVLKENYLNALTSESKAIGQVSQIQNLNDAIQATQNPLGALVSHIATNPFTSTSHASTASTDPLLSARQSELSGLQQVEKARSQLADPTVTSDPVRLAKAQVLEQSGLETAATARVKQLKLSGASSDDINAATSSAARQSLEANKTRVSLAEAQGQAVEDEIANIKSEGVGQSVELDFLTQQLNEHAANEALFSSLVDLQEFQEPSSPDPLSILDGDRTLSQLQQKYQEAVLERANIRNQGILLEGAEGEMRRAASLVDPEAAKFATELADARFKYAEAVRNAKGVTTGEKVQAAEGKLRGLEAKQLENVTINAKKQKTELWDNYKSISDKLAEAQKGDLKTSPELANEVSKFKGDSLPKDMSLTDLKTALDNSYGKQFHAIDPAAKQDRIQVQMDQAAARGDIDTVKSLREKLDKTILDRDVIKNGQLNQAILKRVEPVNRLFIFDRILAEGKEKLDAFESATDTATKQQSETKLKEWLKANAVTKDGLRDMWKKYFGEATTLAQAREAVNGDFRGDYQGYLAKVQQDFGNFLKSRNLLPKDVELPKSHADFLNLIEKNKVFDDPSKVSSNLAALRGDIKGYDLKQYGRDIDRATMARLFGEAVFTGVKFKEDSGRLSGAQTAMLSLFGSRTNAGVDAGGGKTEAFMMDAAVHSLILGESMRGEILVEDSQAAQKYVTGRASTKLISDAFGLELVDGSRLQKENKTGELIQAFDRSNAVVILDPTSRGFLMNNAVGNAALRRALQVSNMIGYDEVHMAATNRTSAIIGGNMRAPEVDTVNRVTRLYNELSSRLATTEFKNVTVENLSDFKQQLSDWKDTKTEGVIQFNGRIGASDQLLENLDAGGSFSSGEIRSVLQVLLSANGDSSGWAVDKGLIYPVNELGKIETSQISNDIALQIAAARKTGLDPYKSVRVQDTEMQTALSSIVENPYARQVGGSATIDGLNRLLSSKIGTETVGVSTTRLNLSDLVTNGDLSENLRKGEIVSDLDLNTEAGKKSLAEKMLNGWDQSHGNLLIATQDVKLAKFYEDLFNEKGISVATINGYTDNVNDIANPKKFDGKQSGQVIITNARAFTGVDFQMHADLWVLGAERLPEQLMIQLLKRVNRPGMSRTTRWDASRNLVLTSPDALTNSMKFVKDNAPELNRMWNSGDGKQVSAAGQLLTNFENGKINLDSKSPEEVKQAVELVAFARQADVNSEASKFAIQDTLRGRYVIEPLKELIGSLTKGTREYDSVKSVLDAALNGSRRNDYAALSLSDYEDNQTRSDFMRSTMNQVSREAAGVWNALEGKALVYNPLNWSKAAGQLRSDIADQRALKVEFDQAIKKYDSLNADESHSIAQAKTATELLSVLKSANELVINGAVAATPEMSDAEVKAANKAWSSVQNALKDTDLGLAPNVEGKVKTAGGLGRPLPSITSTLAVQSALRNGNFNLAAMKDGYQRNALANLVSASSLSDLREKLAIYGQQVNQNPNGYYQSHLNTLYGSGKVLADVKNAVSNNLSTYSGALSGATHLVLPTSGKTSGRQIANLIAVVQGTGDLNLMDVPRRAASAQRDVQQQALGQLLALAMNPRTSGSVQEAISQALQTANSSSKKSIAEPLAERLAQIQGIALNATPRDDGYSVQHSAKAGQPVAVMTVNHYTSTAGLRAQSLATLSTMTGARVDINLPSGDTDRVQAYQNLADLANASGGNVRLIMTGTPSVFSAFSLRGLLSRNTIAKGPIDILASALSAVELKLPDEQMDPALSELNAIAPQLRNSLDLGLIRREKLGKDLADLIQKLADASKVNDVSGVRGVLEEYFGQSAHQGSDIQNLLPTLKAEAPKLGFFETLRAAVSQISSGRVSSAHASGRHNSPVPIVTPIGTGNLSDEDADRDVNFKNLAPDAAAPVRLALAASLGALLLGYQYLSLHGLVPDLWTLAGGSTTLFGGSHDVSLSSFFGFPFLSKNVRQQVSKLSSQAMSLAAELRAA